MFTQICMGLYQFKLLHIKSKRFHWLTWFCRNTGAKTGTLLIVERSDSLEELGQFAFIKYFVNLFDKIRVES